MLDTMTITKVLGGLCGAFLIFLLGHWLAEELYYVGGGHGDPKQAYFIDTGEEEDAAKADEGPDFATLLAAADTSKGAKVYSKCKACHKLEAGANGTGPNLYGVVNRAVAAEVGYNYSGALVKVAEVWSPANLNGFLANPKTYARGTKMAFSGLKKEKDRANLIAYLATIGQ